ncbi:MAG TPA: hypothetical protein VK927_06045, partial [Adhaeribacter sp.]|nr:hypothetical protein [Adhaeribacter sp.]
MAPKLLLLFCLLGLAVPVLAGTPDSTAILESKATRIGINTFSWRTNMRGSDSLNSQNRIYYHLSQDFLYNTNQENSRFAREDYFANAIHAWRFRPNWFLEEHFFYQNNRASFAAVSSFTEHLHFRPRNTLAWQSKYSVFAGLKHDSRASEADTGPEFGGTMNLGWVSADGEEMAGTNVFFSQANLSPRTFQRMITDARYEKKFSTFASLALRAEYRRNRAEDYVSNNVQRIQSDTLAAFLTGNYTVSDKLWFRTQNQVLLPDRAFSYRPLTENSPALNNSEYNQFELQTLQEMFFQTQKFRANLQAGYRERNRKYANARDNLKDVLQSTTSWAANFTYLFSETNSLTSQTQGELLRVDTPSEQNNEDRDEVYYGSRLLLTSRWTPRFRTTFGLLGTYREFVYIKAAQSAENFTERTLNYEPGFIWTPGKFSWEAQMQLQAIYQVRKFASEQLKNRSNRTYNQTHRFRYEATRNLHFQL